ITYCHHASETPVGVGVLVLHEFVVIVIGLNIYIIYLRQTEREPRLPLLHFLFFSFLFFSHFLAFWSAKPRLARPLMSTTRSNATEWPFDATGKMASFVVSPQVSAPHPQDPQAQSFRLIMSTEP